MSHISNLVSTMSTLGSLSTGTADMVITDKEFKDNQLFSFATG